MASPNFSFFFTLATGGRLSGWGSNVRLYIKGLIFIKPVSTFRNFVISWITSFHSLKSASWKNRTKRHTIYDILLYHYEKVWLPEKSSCSRKLTISADSPTDKPFLKYYVVMSQPINLYNLPWVIFILFKVSNYLISKNKNKEIRYKDIL